MASSKTKSDHHFIDKNKIFLNAWSSFPSRELGVVKDDDPEKSVAFFEEKFDRLKKEIESIASKISEGPNPGSFLMKLKHLKNKLPEYPGLGDFESLDRMLDELIGKIESGVRENQENNVERKQELLASLSKNMENPNWKESFEAIKKIQSDWIKTGSIPEEHQELEKEFKSRIEEYFENRKNFFDDRKKLGTHYEEKYNELIIEARKLLAKGGDEKALKEIENRWSENGPVPPHIYRPLYNEFKEVVRKLKRPKSEKKNVLKEIQDHMAKVDQPSEGALLSWLKKLQRYRPHSQNEKSHINSCSRQSESKLKKSFLKKSSKRSQEGENFNPRRIRNLSRSPF